MNSVTVTVKVRSYIASNLERQISYLQLFSIVSYKFARIVANVEVA